MTASWWPLNSSRSKLERSFIYYFQLLCEREARLSQRDRATRYVTKLVLCFMRYGS